MKMPGQSAGHFFYLVPPFILSAFILSPAIFPPCIASFPLMVAPFSLSLDILSPFILPCDNNPGFILSLLILPAVILWTDILSLPILSGLILSWARTGRAMEPQIIVEAAPNDRL